MTTLIYRYRFILLLILPLLTFSGHAATDKYWVCGAGDWVNPACWSLTEGGTGGTGIPGTGDYVRLAQTPFVNVSYSNLINPDAVLGSLAVNLELSVLSSTLRSDYISVGQGHDGLMIQEGGDVIASTLVLGEGGYGIYRLNDGNLNTAFTGVGDFFGTKGEFFQNGGVHTATSLYLGLVHNDGFYTLADGELSVETEIVGAYEYAIGFFTQTGGTHSAIDLTVGSTYASDSTFNLEGGTLSVDTEIIGTLVGPEGNGDFIQTAGNHYVNNLYISYDASEFGSEYGSFGNGTYSLKGGMLDAEVVKIGGIYINGKLMQDGGNFEVGSLTLSSQNTSEGEAPVYALHNGEMKAGEVAVGATPYDSGYRIEKPIGNFAQDGGNASVANNFAVIIGEFSLHGGMFDAYHLNNNDTISYSRGVLHVNDFSNSADATLHMSVAGYTPLEEHGVVDVANIATLSGILEVSLHDNFIPNPGDSFEIIRAAVIDGKFDNFKTPTFGNNLVFEPHYGSNSVIITAVTKQKPLPVSWWPADGNANDYADGNHGTLLSGASYATGKVSEAFSFTSNCAHVRIPDSDNLDITNALTMAAWVYPTSYGTSYTPLKNPTIFSKWDAVGINHRSYVLFLDITGKAFLHVSPDGSELGLDVGTVISNTVVPLNQWTHVAGVYDGTVLRMYINGVLENTVAYNQGIFVGSNDLAIGATVGGVSSGNCVGSFSGRIDEVRIYNQALLNKDIEELVRKQVHYLKPLGDINGDTTQDIATLVNDSATGTVKTYVKDTGNGATINIVSFDAAYSTTQFATMPDANANGAPELVVVGKNPSNGDVRAEIRDSLSSQLLNKLSYNQDFTPKQVSIVPDMNGNGADEVALLVKQGSNNQLKVVVKDGMNDAWLGTFPFNSDYEPQDMKVLPDQNGNGVPELAVLAIADVASEPDKVEIRDLKNGALLNNIWINKIYDPKQMELLSDLNGNGQPELGIMMTGSVKAEVRDSKTGNLLTSIWYNTNYIPEKLVAVPDINGDGAHELGVLGRLDAKNYLRTVFKDSRTAGYVSNVWFDANTAVHDMSVIDDINSNGSSELVLLGTLNGKLRAIVKDAKTGQQISNFKIQ